MKRKKKQPVSQPHFRPKEKDEGPPDSQSGTDGGFALKARLWIAGGDSTFLAFGRVTLLSRIREYGSITKAARSMGMSYRHAWELVESMNALAPRPVVITSTGGRGGGGTAVTPEGEKMIELFRKLHRDLSAFLEQKQAKLKDL